MNNLREECEEALFALADFKEQQFKSKHPEKFSDAIRVMRRKTLGLYTQLMNQRTVIPTDSLVSSTESSTV
jgi:hypothetical protein